MRCGTLFSTPLLVDESTLAEDSVGEAEESGFDAISAKMRLPEFRRTRECTKTLPSEHRSSVSLEE